MSGEYNCDHCDEDFSSKIEKLRHEIEEHEDDFTSHERDSKKNELNRLEQEKQTKKHNRKKMLQYSAVSLLLVSAVAGAGFHAYNTGMFSSTNPVESGSANVSAGVGQFIHWHAPYTIKVCGEEKILEGGPHLAHTHGESKFHLEGQRTSKEQGTLDWIVDQLGGEFSNDGIMGYEEPESCPGSDEPGELTVKVNGQELENPEGYIVRDGDNIRIVYK